MTVLFSHPIPVPDPHDLHEWRATPPVTLQTTISDTRQQHQRMSGLLSRQTLLLLLVTSIAAITIDQRCDALLARIAVLEHQLQQVQADLIKEQQASARLDAGVESRIEAALGERIIAAVSPQDGGWLIEHLEHKQP